MSTSAFRNERSALTEMSATVLTPPDVRATQPWAGGHEVLAAGPPPLPAPQLSPVGPMKELQLEAEA